MTAAPNTTSTLRLPAHSRAVPTHTRLRTRRLPSTWVALTALSLAVAVVVGAHLSGLWVTSGRGAVSAMTGTSGESGARADSSAPATPQDVKGWMSLQQVLDAGLPGVSESALRADLGIPSSVPNSTALKDLPALVDGLDVPALRSYLADAAQSDG